MVVERYEVYLLRTAHPPPPLKVIRQKNKNYIIVASPDTTCHENFSFGPCLNLGPRDFKPCVELSAFCQIFVFFGKIMRIFLALQYMYSQIFETIFYPFFRCSTLE
jgi:hypothetical protein